MKLKEARMKLRSISASLQLRIRRGLTPLADNALVKKLGRNRGQAMRTREPLLYRDGFWALVFLCGMIVWIVVGGMAT